MTTQQNNHSISVFAAAVMRRIGVIGVTLAVIMSWARNHSIWWAILHGCFGWFYVIYYALT